MIKFCNLLEDDDPAESDWAEKSGSEDSELPDYSKTILINIMHTVFGFKGRLSDLPGISPSGKEHVSFDWNSITDSK